MLRGFSNAVILVVSLSSTSAFAQTMTPTQTQRSYNDRGVQHMFDGEFEQAAANFKSSLSLGDSNIAWLNYGRALFKLRRCHEARDALGQVSSSPVVAAPSPEEIATVLSKFEDEWSASCTGRLTLECPDATAVVRLDTSAPFDCHEDPIPVVPGLHNVTIPEWEESFAVRVSAEPAMLSLQRSLEPPPAEEDAPTIDVEESGTRYAGLRGGTRRLVGALLAGTGLVAAGTGLALEAAWVGPAFDDYEAAETPDEWASARDVVVRRQRVNRALLFAGLGMTAVGATVYLLPRRERGPIALRLGLTGPTSVGAEVRW